MMVVEYLLVEIEVVLKWKKPWELYFFWRSMKIFQRFFMHMR